MQKNKRSSKFEERYQRRRDKKYLSWQRMTHPCVMHFFLSIGNIMLKPLKSVISLLCNNTSSANNKPVKALELLWQKAIF